MINIDSEPSKNSILTPEQVAEFLQVSLSWVYQNAHLLGGIKLGGTIRSKLRFPSKEDIYGRLFCEWKGMEVPFQTQQNEVHWNLVQDEKRGSRNRNDKTERNQKLINITDLYKLKLRSSELGKSGPVPDFRDIR